MRELAIYPGTFDPFTNGHLDIIKRSVALFDRVIIAVAKSQVKKPMFCLEHRKDMIDLIIKENSLANVECIAFEGLLADLAKSYNSKVVIRGLRVVSDFEYELQMGYANASLNPLLDTIYFMPTLQNAFISSSIVRSILAHGGNFSHLVPKEVCDFIENLRHADGGLDLKE